MNKNILLAASIAVTAFFPSHAAVQKPAVAHPSPGEIVNAAPASEWKAIASSDLLVMELEPDTNGRKRQIIIQLMPAPFSQGWIGNIRKLATAHWWDGTTVYRVQDNYVAQWGDADGDDEAKAKKLPDGLAVMSENAYTIAGKNIAKSATVDAYAPHTGFFKGWPFAGNATRRWPVHCYGAVGVARDMSPNTGTGSELYTVIGHAPRHLDRNIAVVGRIIEGIENLSSLPRGTEALGIYKTEQERVPIVSVRLGSELTAADQPQFEYLSTVSASFTKYAASRKNRRDPFFIKPAGGADICNIPVPIRRITG